MQPRLATLARGTAMVLLFASSSPVAIQAKVVTLDLSQVAPGADNPISVPEGELTLEVINKLPLATYRIVTQIEVQEIPPLPLPTSESFGLKPGPGPSITPECDDLLKATNDLASSKAEEKVPELVKIIDDKMTGCRVSDPEPGEDPAEARRLVHDLKARATSLVEKTREAPLSVMLELGTALSVKVARVEDGKEVKTWNAMYQAPAVGKWFASYGFSFIPNQDERYFSKAAESGESGFVVTRKRETQEFDFAPSVFYAFMPSRWQNQALSHSLVAGLGFDLSRPVVFLGYGLTVRHNVMIVLGGTMHTQRRLNGQYVSGQKIGENLSEDQLTEGTYDLNWFTGLSFRFDSAPESHKPPKKVEKKDQKEAEKK